MPMAVTLRQTTTIEKIQRPTAWGAHAGYEERSRLLATIMEPKAEKPGQG